MWMLKYRAMYSYAYVWVITNGLSCRFHDVTTECLVIYDIVIYIYIMAYAIW